MWELLAAALLALVSWWFLPVGRRQASSVAQPEAAEPDTAPPDNDVEPTPIIDGEVTVDAPDSQAPLVNGGEAVQEVKDGEVEEGEEERGVELIDYLNDPATYMASSAEVRALARRAREEQIMRRMRPPSPVRRPQPLPQRMPQPQPQRMPQPQPQFQRSNRPGWKPRVEYFPLDPEPEPQPVVEKVSEPTDAAAWVADFFMQPEMPVRRPKGSVRCNICERFFVDDQALDRHHFKVHLTELVQMSYPEVYDPELSRPELSPPEGSSSEVSEHELSDGEIYEPDQSTPMDVDDDDIYPIESPAVENRLECDCCDETFELSYHFRTHKSKAHTWATLCTEHLATFRSVAQAMSHYLAEHDPAYKPPEPSDSRAAAIRVAPAAPSYGWSNPTPDVPTETETWAAAAGNSPVIESSDSVSQVHFCSKCSKQFSSSVDLEQHVVEPYVHGNLTAEESARHFPALRPDSLPVKPPVWGVSPPKSIDMPPQSAALDESPRDEYEPDMPIEDGWPSESPYGYNNHSGWPSESPFEESGSSSEDQGMSPPGATYDGPDSWGNGPVDPMLDVETDYEIATEEPARDDDPVATDVMDWQAGVAPGPPSFNLPQPHLLSSGGAGRQSWGARLRSASPVMPLPPREQVFNSSPAALPPRPYRYSTSSDDSYRQPDTEYDEYVSEFPTVMPSFALGGAANAKPSSPGSSSDGIREVSPPALGSGAGKQHGAQASARGQALVLDYYKQIPPAQSKGNTRENSWSVGAHASMLERSRASNSNGYMPYMISSEPQTLSDIARRDHAPSRTSTAGRRTPTVAKGYNAPYSVASSGGMGHDAGLEPRFDSEWAEVGVADPSYSRGGRAPPPLETDPFDTVNGDASSNWGWGQTPSTGPTYSSW